MRIFHWIGHVANRVLVAGVTGSVALLSRGLDATIGLVGRSSERLDAELGGLARASNERRRREGRRALDPITLD
ncbi:hypothetical protein MKL09_28485 [Methylobacterium sp. J-048]|uniref:hypothetical protein n=1 Tax=Methylobacterium sp. J-048 TaxID=2836635 RepID=UPI001FBA424A|nr:hypothetical protein [Methylobacterium sp. J-048]MCJ2060449.1 hypothetical protein [Methylobacterium sp. J-048]